MNAQPHQLGAQWLSRLIHTLSPQRQTWRSHGQCLASPARSGGIRKESHAVNSYDKWWTYSVQRLASEFREIAVQSWLVVLKKLLLVSACLRETLAWTSSSPLSHSPESLCPRLALGPHPRAGESWFDYLEGWTSFPVVVSWPSGKYVFFLSPKFTPVGQRQARMHRCKGNIHCRNGSKWAKNKRGHLG